MSDLPPANWYPDPEVPGQQRYWDGTQWTEHRAPGAGATQEQPAWSTSSSGQAWSTQGQTQGYAPSSSGSTNGLALTSLILAVVSFFLAFIAVGALGGIVAVVLGIMALRAIGASGGAQGGRGLAITGIVVGGLSILIGIVMTIIFVFVGTAIDEGTTGFSDFFECIEEEARTGQDLDC